MGASPMRPVFEKTLVRAGAVRSYQIRMGSNGWEAASKQDEQTVAHQHHADWHQVERTLTKFETEIETLRAQGWRDS
jgi:hypothetical protein